MHTLLMAFTAVSRTCFFELFRTSLRANWRGKFVTETAAADSCFIVDSRHHHHQQQQQQQQRRQQQHRQLYCRVLQRAVILLS
jgi:hypothetical protein